MFVGSFVERFNIVSNDHGRMQKYDFCFCLKSEMLCILWFSPSSFFPGLLRNIGEFGAKIYFTDHLKPNKILGVRDSVLACKIPESSCRIRKNSEQYCIPSHSSDASDYNSTMGRLARWIHKASKSFQTYLALQILIKVI